MLIFSPTGALLLLLATTGPADAAKEWHSLLDGRDLTAASERCTSWLGAAEPRMRAEAHKCLANVELALGSGRAETATSEGKSGSEVMSAALQRAVHHLDEGVELAPDDLSIHQGRLHLLQMAGVMTEMVRALEDSIRRHPGRDWLPAWRGYPVELYQAGRFEQAVVLYRVLDRHFPDEHTILANMGAALAMMKRDDEALGCLTRAVKLAPDDPVDNWNLARLYDFADKLELAEKQYERALALKLDDAARASATCAFAEFLEKKRKDRDRACQLQRQAACGEKTACGHVSR